MGTHSNTYWKDIVTAIMTLAKGLKVTATHFRHATKQRTPVSITSDEYFEQDKGLATLQYPHETFAVPDNGRYQLHNEIDDCIVCDKCAKICPVDCIDIEPIRATEEIGKTSDGTPKRIYAAKFDIDMGKCCFCGLCTTVCPTECLTMTKSYDFSEYDVRDHNYAFATMTPLEILEKQQQLDEYNQQKEVAKQANQKVSIPRPKPKIGGATKPKPSFKPRMMPKIAKKPKNNDEKEGGN